MVMEINVDNDKCIGALDCRQCFLTCPTKVFMTAPTKVWKFKETDRKDFAILARYYDQCISCMECVKICPGQAISVHAK
jgi:NAD-dependent dihydropyrimidine dehydrogenase PreA subunit